MLLDNILIIFVKYPRPGFVKTRLAKTIGEEKAALLYRLFVEAISERTKDISFKRFVFYHPSEEKELVRDWLGNGFKFYPQKGDTLGERLSNAFRFTFGRGAQRVIAIGTDSPSIDKTVILNAFEELKDTQCVLGPSLDGGYYLIGLSFFKKGLFEEIRWGTSKVFEQTINRLKEMGLRYELLNKSFDIDHYKDILLLKQRLQKVLKINPAGLNPILEALDEIIS